MNIFRFRDHDFQSRQLIAWIIVISLIRLFFIAFNGRELFVDEAQYWAWSQKLAWGYHSKPPLIAWFIALSTHYLGNTEFAIRLFAPLCYALSSYFVYLATEQLYDKQSAFWAALSWLVLPSISFSASIMSTDPFLLCAESLMLYSLAKALKDPKFYNWLALGLFLGLSYLSKYTGLFFILSFLLYLACSERYRYLLLRPGPYVALVISFLVLWPNLLWNMQHHFLAFQHVSQHNIALGQAGLHPLRLLNFWLAQMAMLGPFFLLALILLLKQFGGLPKQEVDKLLLCFVFPAFVAVSLEEFLVHGYDNWASIIYLPLIIWLSHYLVVSKRLSLLKWNWYFSVMVLVLVYSFELILHFNDWQLTDRFNPYKRQSGWHQAQIQMRALQRGCEDYNYLLDGRVVFFKSLFYLQINPAKAYLWGPNQAVENEYNLTTDLANAEGENFIFLTGTLHHASLYQQFQSMEVAGTIQLPVSRDKTETLYWIVLKGYQGERATTRVAPTIDHGNA